MLHKLVQNECATFRNHAVGAVERGDFESATKLVTELRKYEKLFATTNVEAHDFIDRLKS
jgi:hypothetical protein